ncbi:hypothetical protein [Oceanobacillus sp. CAU 1775]
MWTKKIIVISLGILLFLVFGFTIKTVSYPPDNTRIILEHTYETYIAPPCFEGANTTNNLEETTLQKAKQLNYEIQSPCSKKKLEEVSEPLLQHWLRKIGLLKSEWDW